MKPQPKIRKITQRNQDMFFKNIETHIGEVFTYSQAFMPNEIEKIALERKYIVEYCPPETKEYKMYGCQTMKIIKDLQDELDVDMNTKIRNGYYKNRFEYPKNISKKTFICPDSECLNNIPKESNFCPKCGADVRGYYEELKSNFNDKLAKYREEESRLSRLFKDDLLNEFNLKKLPNADAIFAYAWEHGHSAGHHEVYNYMIDLADLFEPYLKFVGKDGETVLPFTLNKNIGK